MTKTSRYTLLLGVAVAITMVISACGSSSTTTGTTPTTSSGSSTLGTPGSFNCVTGSITASGSTALAPLVKAVATSYQGKCSGATITVNLGGSKTGLSQVQSGAVDIGNSDVKADPATQSDLVDHQVAVVIFAMIVNKGVGVTNLTTDQIKGIYAGTTTNWNQVGGGNIPIVVVSRPASSGTRATFSKYVIGGPETVSGPSSLTTDSTGTVITNVAQNAGAVGYAATGPAMKEAGITLLSIDGNAPTADNTKSNTYKFWNIEHMYTKGPATGLAQAFIDYMTSPDAEAIAQQQDFVAISQMSPDAITAHNAVP
ncbi:MAG TPA: phosphate ABC transporter substrate-binding protein [Ktedonobacteraceae bacterium]|jgi:phosphate transport system substrate-binding protein|nr:phosphate ABC transporter substrate-binding protein [Ktedonobacteraceae bacterium]